MADLQPTGRYRPDRTAIDQKAIHSKEQQYWLYAAVDPETNELLHMQLEPTTNSVLAQQFLAQLCEKHGVVDVVFLIDGSLSLKDACSRHGRDLRVERHGIATVSNVSFEK